MTRKHFIEAARIVRSFNSERDQRAAAVAYVRLFEQFNPQFDRERFYKACGLETM